MFPDFDLFGNLTENSDDKIQLKGILTLFCGFLKYSRDDLFIYRPESNDVEMV